MSSLKAPSVNALPAELAVLRPRMDAVSLSDHARPELKFAEFHARQVLTRRLAEAGLTVTAPAGSLDTVFVALHEGSRPGPCVAEICTPGEELGARARCVRPMRGSSTG